VCNDGFTAGTVREDEFRSLTGGLGVELDCLEVDGSSIFYLLTTLVGNR